VTLALLFSGLTGVGLVLVRRLEWAPAASFDITGFLWVLTNLGPLLAASGVLACGCCAVYCWVRVLQESL
jgi:hypothetical protein